MRLVLGTYRNKKHLPVTLKSLYKNLKGVDELVFIDDSPVDEDTDWLKSHGRVIRTRGLGYCRAMYTACLEMTPPYSCWWEEDSVLDREVDLNKIAEELENDSTLAQFVFLRQPWFAAELEHSDIIQPMIERRPSPITLEEGVHEKYWKHQSIFSTNPGVWQPRAWEHLWPLCGSSEDEKTRYLLQEGLWFATQHQRSITHFGRRSGHGY